MAGDGTQPVADGEYLICGSYDRLAMVVHA